MDPSYDCPVLPRGLRRGELAGKAGLSSGKIEVVYSSPCGRRFRSKLQLAKFLGPDVDLAAFDYKTGKINALQRRYKRPRNEFGRSSRNDSSLIPPIRQTASIFKQPVTLHKNQPDSRSRADLKHGHVQEKPSQVFWERRIEGLKASSLFPDEEVVEFRLPRSIRPIGPQITEDTAIRSLAAALHLRPQQVITGQQASRSVIDKNPGVYVNPQQPLVAAISLTDEDLGKQENKVRSARKSLQELLDY